MVGGFNHIDLGKLNNNRVTLNEELSVKIIEMLKNGKPLICKVEYDNEKYTLIMNQLDSNTFFYESTSFFSLAVNVDENGNVTANII